MAVTPSIFGEPSEPPEGPAPGVFETIGDVGKAAAAGTADVAAQGVGLLSDSFHAPPGSGPRELQDRLNEVGDTIKEYIAPANRKAMEADIIPQDGQPSALKTPVRSGLMKLGSMTPQLLGALFLPEGLAGVVSGSALFGAQGAGQLLNDSRKQIMGLTDEELSERSPLYRGLRNDNDETTARQKLMDAGSDALSVILAAGSNAAAGGAMAHALKAQAAKGVLPAIGVGTGDALAGGFVQGAGSEAGRQNADVNMGTSDGLDVGKDVLAGLNSALMFAPLGAAAGVARGVGARRASRAEREKANGTAVDPNGPSPAQTAAIDGTLNPVADGDTPTPPSEPPAAPPPVPAGAPPAPAGTLSVRVDAERARRAALPPETPVAPPPGAGVPLRPRPIHEEPLPDLPAQPPPRPREPLVEPVVEPPAPLPVTPEGKKPLNAAEVKAAVETMPQKKAPAEPPPATVADPLDELNTSLERITDPAKAALRERMATDGKFFINELDGSFTAHNGKLGNDVPLEPTAAERKAAARAKANIDLADTPEERAAAKAELNAALHPAVLRALNKEQPAAPLVEKPVAALVEKPAGTLSLKRKNPITELREAANAEAKPRVLKAKVEPEVVALRDAKAEAEAEAESEVLREAARKSADAERKRQDRLTKQTLPNEEKAAKVVQASHPEKGSEAEADLQTIEQAALGSGTVPGTVNARELLRGRGNELVAAAENAGVRIPRRTTSSRELPPEQRNPTPFTSRLTEIKRFDGLVKVAERIPEPSRREARLRQLYQHYVMTERALRAGDLETAAERRIRANEERTEKFRNVELAKLEKEQRADQTDEKANSLKVEESDARVTRKGKVDHYAVDETKGVRHSDVETELGQLAHEFGRMKDPRAKLLTHIMRKIADKVGNTPMHFVHDPDMKASIGLTPDRPGVFRFLKEGAVGSHRGEIFIDNDIVHDVRGAQAILHEAIHPAINHAIDHNPQLHADLMQVRRIAEQTLRYAGKDPADEYAFTATRKAPEYMRDMPAAKHGVTDVREFVAEAIAKPSLRKHMIQTKAPGWMVQQWHLNNGASLWRAFVARITQAMGLGDKHVTLMDALLHHVDKALEYEPPDTGLSLKDLRSPAHEVVTSAIHVPTKDEVREAAPIYAGSIRNRVRGALNKIATFDQIAQGANKLFGEGDLPTKLSRTMARMAHEKSRILEESGANALVDRTAKMVRKYTASKQAEAYGNFLLDETGAGVFADKPLAGQKGVTTQGKARHAELAAVYNRLPEELKRHRADAQAYLKKTQDEASLAQLRNIVRVINDGVPDDALAERIFHKNYVDEVEKDVVERDGVIKAINNARALQVKKGPYFPMMRHGDHVVSGVYKIETPHGAERLNDEGKPDPKGNVFQFRTKAEARKFAGDATLHVLKEQHFYVDKDTGSRWDVEEDGTRHRLTKEDWAANDADEVWRVKLQDRHLEFFDTEVYARQRHAELSGRPDLTLDGVTPVKWQPTGQNATFLSHEFDRTLNSLRQRAGFKALPEEARREMESHLRDAFLSALGPTRAQSRRLPRSYVAGASNDIFKSLRQYASSMSGYIARQKHQPQVDALMKQLNDYNEAHRYEDTSRTYPRGQALKEIQQRVFSQGEPEPTGIFHKGVSRLLQLSMLDKLASPAYHVINSSEPFTISLPVLAGRHGVGKSLFEINRAYRDIGAASVIKQGATNTVRAFKNDIREADYLKPIYDRVKKAADGKHLQDMMTELHDIGVVSKDAGMEIGRMSDPNAGMLGRGLDRADLMARQLGTAVESVNRLVTAIAAYRLEFDKTKDHQKAKDYAVQQTIDTMGDYSGWNAPAAFNHPLGRLALQFKKYAQKTYYLLGKTALASLKGDREAMKQFGGIMATHALLAGALGLPLEAVKAAFLGAGLVGATNSNYGDFEQYVRRQAAGLLGNVGGEIATRGLPRYLGVDLSSRVGLENLILPFGDPKSMKPQDLLAYAAQAFAGAPISMIAEYPKGMKALVDGNIVEAARILVPLKVFADTMQAAQRMTVGKQTPSGKTSMTPYSIGEAATKALGFTPGRDAETSEMRAATQGDLNRFHADRSKLVSGWVTAAPNDKTTAWHKVQEWNAGQSANAKITMAELSRGVQRRKREEASPDNADAIRTTNRDRHIRADNSFYVR